MTKEEAKNIGATHGLIIDGVNYYYRLIGNYLYFLSPISKEFGLVNERIDGLFHLHDMYEDLK